MSKYSDSDRWVFKDVGIAIGMGVLVSLVSFIMPALFPSLNIIFDYLTGKETLLIIFTISFFVFLYILMKQSEV